MKTHEHKKTAALATEMLNDWKAIFQVLDQPHHPFQRSRLPVPVLPNVRMSE